MLVVLRNRNLNMHLNKFLFFIALITLCNTNILACHKGGPMGFATNDPGGFSLDITLSPTYTGASTIGTLDCKNWDYALYKKNHFLQSQWSFLNEEASQGNGENIVALAQIMGCKENRQSAFSILLHENYTSLFGNSKPTHNFFNKLKILIARNPSYYCS